MNISNFYFEPAEDGRERQLDPTRADKPWEVRKKPSSTSPVFNNPAIATEMVTTCTGPRTPDAACIGPYGHPIVTMVFDIPTITDNNRSTSATSVPALDEIAFVSSYTGYSSLVCSGLLPSGLTENYDGSPTLVRNANTGTYTVKTKLDPLQIGSSLSFCVKVELRLGTTSAGGYDTVVYEEFAAMTTLNFDGTFKTDSARIRGYQNSQGSGKANSLLTLNAYRCDNNFKPNSAAVLMGQVMHLCITDANTYTDPTYQKRFTSATPKSLQLFQDNPVVDITQNLVPSTADKASLLLHTDKNVDNTIMRFEILVTEEFYRERPNSPNPVIITGSVTGVDFTRRVLLDVDSQEQMIGEDRFEMIIRLEGKGRSPTGISLVVVGALVSIALAVAFGSYRLRRKVKKTKDPTDDSTSCESQEQSDC